MVKTTPRPLYPQERPGTHFIGGWMGTRAGLDGWGRSRPPPGFDPRTVQPAASRYTDRAIPAHGLQIDNAINWKNQTEQMMGKLIAVCYVVRSTVRISSIIIKSVYYAYFHCVVKYGIIFWVNSSNSGKIFTLQKKIVKIMAVAQPGISCISLFIHVPCQYTLSSVNVIINNQELFHTNSFIHNINTRNKHHLHRRNANLSCFQKKYILC